MAAFATGADAALRYVPFSSAPRPVQKDLISVLGRCHEPAERIRRASRFAVAPLGGPGRQSYLFVLSAQQWRSRSFPTGDICWGNFTWKMIWMPVGAGRFRGFEFDNGLVYVRGSRFLVLDPDRGCRLNNAGSWDDCVRFLRWDRRSSTFRPVTRDMLDNAAAAWAQGRGYRRYY